MNGEEPSAKTLAFDRDSLLTVEHLRVEFPTRHGTLVALDSVSFAMGQGESLGVVGESVPASRSPAPRSSDCLIRPDASVPAKSAQIIALLKRLCRAHQTAVMLITHDMGVIAEAADRVAVMYAGRAVEIGPTAEVIHRPLHLYTLGLMASIPSTMDNRDELAQIDGAMPKLNAIPRGCAFHPRCGRAFERCREVRPDLVTVGDVQVACWLYGPDANGAVS